MRKPKDLFLEDGQKCIINGTEILMFMDYRRISNKNAARLGKWLIKASEYLKNKKVKIDTSGYLP
jgi:hypothetical protein